MKKSISVVTLFPGAGQYYAGQIRELFGDLVEVYSYSTSDRSVEKITRTDLYLVSTDAFKIAEEESQYVPADGQVVEIYVGYSKDVIRRLKEPGCCVLMLRTRWPERPLRSWSSQV